MWLQVSFVKHSVESREPNKHFSLLQDVDPIWGNSLAFSRSFPSLLAETFQERSRLPRVDVRDSALGSVLGSLKTVTDRSHKFSVHAAKVVEDIDRQVLPPPGEQGLIHVSLTRLRALLKRLRSSGMRMCGVPLCRPVCSSVKHLRLKVEALHLL